MKNVLKFFGILKNTEQGKNNASLIEDIYIDMEEEIAFAKAVDAWEREEGALIKEEARKQAQDERLAYSNQQHELTMEYLGA